METEKVCTEVAKGEHNGKKEEVAPWHAGMHAVYTEDGDIGNSFGMWRGRSLASDGCAMQLEQLRVEMLGETFGKA